MVAAGVIRTDRKRPFERRLLEIAGGLRRLIEEHAPESAAVEGVFYSANVKTAGLEMAEYSPLEVKTSVVGYGRAEKSQVKLMVRSLLRLPEAIESEDACDALAVAICHATRESTRRKLG